MAEYDIPEDLHYSTEDEWARLEGKRVTIGITDYAQQQLGDIVFVELPEVGASIDQSEAFGVVESVKAVSDLFAPLGGEVVAVNGDLVESPEVVNEACYAEGWLIVLEMAHPDEAAQLLSAEAYRKHIAERSD